MQGEVMKDDNDELMEILNKEIQDKFSNVVHEFIETNLGKASINDLMNMICKNCIFLLGKAILAFPKEARMEQINILIPRVRSTLIQIMNDYGDKV